MKLTKFIALVAAVATFAVGCEEGVSGGGNTSGKAVLTANNTSVEVNTPITFTVTAEDGTDITAQSSIFDKTHDFVEVSNPFTPTVDGNYEFYAVCGNVITDAITVSVVPTIPELPEDGDKANTSFNHRILLVDHTGTGCSYCPQMMSALKSVSETGDYHSKYYEAMAHTYSNGDPAYSGAANVVSNHHGVSSYPALTYNFYHSTQSSYNAAHIMGQIDALWKAEGADAGIAAAATLASTSVIVNTEVKAAKANDYRITAWLLEDGIYAKQTNATEEWMNTHSSVMRDAPTGVSNSDISGIDFGYVEAGTTLSRIFEFDLFCANHWKKENFSLIAILSAPSEKYNGKYEVVTTSMCEFGSEAGFDYKR